MPYERKRAMHSGNRNEVVQAAASIMRGMDKGGYHIKTPDFGSNLLISSTMSSLTPRMYPLIVELFLSPLAVLAVTAFRFLIDNIVRRERRKREEVSALNSK